MASTDARPVPLKNVAYRVTFPIFDGSGDLVTGAASLDSEVSKDNGAFADCTNEATEIGSTGIYWLDITSTEMNADQVTVIVKTSTTGAKTTPIFLYPQEVGDLKVDLQSVNASATGVDKLSAHLPTVLKAIIGAGSSTTAVKLDASTGVNGGVPSMTDDFYNGQIIKFTSGTLAGQAAAITGYAAASTTLTVTALTGAPAAADVAVMV